MAPSDVNAIFKIDQKSGMKKKFLFWDSEKQIYVIVPIYLIIARKHFLHNIPYFDSLSSLFFEWISMFLDPFVTIYQT